MPKNVELLDNTNDILYPKTKTEQVIVTSTQNLNVKLADIDTKIKSVTDEVVNARPDKKGVAHPTLKARLDAMEDGSTNIQNTLNQVQATANQANTTANQANTTANATKQEVEQARGGQANLNNRLNAMTNATTQAQQTATTANNTANNVKQEIDNAKAPNATLKEKLDSINGKFANYLPLAGGTVTGNLEVNGNLTNGTHQVWHKGNAPIDTNATPNTVVKRLASGNINVGTGVAFNDATGGGAYLGGIGIGSGNSSGVAYTNQPIHLIPQRGNTQIWTHETMRVESGDWSPQFTASNGGTCAYDSRGGRYHRVGNMVIVTFNLIARNPVNFNGQLSVTNLPFTNATGIHVGCTLFAIRGFNVGAPTNNRQICAYVRPNESRIIFNYSDTSITPSNIAVLQQNHLITSNVIELSGTVVFKIS